MASTRNEQTVVRNIARKKQRAKRKLRYRFRIILVRQHLFSEHFVGGENVSDNTLDISKSDIPFLQFLEQLVDSFLEDCC